MSEWMMASLDICFTNWGNFQLCQVEEVGQQRVKLDGRAARDPFGGERIVININVENFLNYCSDMKLRYLTMFFSSFSNLLSHILVQVQNERFHHQRHSPSSLQKLFSLYSSLGQFLGPCNFLAISLRAQKLVRKGSLLIPAPISSPLTQLQATNPRQISDNFWKRKLSWIAQSVRS